VTQILSDFAEDLEKDGTLTDAAIGNDLETHLYYVDTTAVLNNFKVKYRKLYNVDTVNSVDLRFIKNFQNNTTYSKDKDLIEYPSNSYNYSGANILNSSVTEYNWAAGVVNGADGWNIPLSSTLSRKGISLKIEITDENGNPFISNNRFCYFGTWKTVVGWQRSGDCSDGNFKALSLAIYDYYWAIEKSLIFNVGTKIKINFFEKGFTTSNRSKIVTLK
jgi:hypothetical protein